MSEPIAKGTRIASATGKEFGVTTGKRRMCRAAECPGLRYQVEWDDGQRTWVCSENMVISGRYGLMIGYGDPELVEEDERVGPAEPLTEEEKFRLHRDYLLILAQEAFDKQGWKLCLEEDKHNLAHVDVSAAALDSMTSLIVEIAASVAASPTNCGKEAAMAMARQMIMAADLMIKAALDISPETQIEIHCKDSQIVKHGEKKPFSQWEPANGKKQAQT